MPDSFEESQNCDGIFEIDGDGYMEIMIKQWAKNRIDDLVALYLTIRKIVQVALFSIALKYEHDIICKSNTLYVSYLFQISLFFDSTYCFCQWVLALGIYPG